MSRTWPGGLLAFAFSNRWFPPKAIRIWTEMHEFERLGLVAALFHLNAGFRDITTLSRRGRPMIPVGNCRSAIPSLWSGV